MATQTLSGDKIDILGLRDFQRELRALHSKLPRQLRIVNKRVADRIAEKTKQSFRSRSRVAHEVAESVRAQAQQRNAAILLGGPKAPMAEGSEFGSQRFKQFPAWRGSGGGAGYSLFPTIRQSRQQIIDMYGDELDSLAKKAFPN